MLAKFKKKYIGDWDFYQKYLLLAIPMILQNAITNLVSFLDNIMVGQLGTEQMSGVAIVNQLIFVYNLAIFGAVSAASIFGAQYFGKGNHKGHMYSFRFKLYATLLVTGGAILLFLTKGSALISLYLTDTVGNGATDLALQYGLEYLAIMMVGLIPFAVNQSYATNIKETGQTFIPMLASFVAVGTNAILDYLMIFGIGPFPELGVQGAALATVIARYIEALIVGTHPSGKKPLSGGSLHRLWYSACGIEGDPDQGISADDERGAVGSGHDNGDPVLFCQRSGRGGGTEHCLHHHESVQYCLSSAGFLYQYCGGTVSGCR